MLTHEMYNEPGLYDLQARQGGDNRRRNQMSAVKGDKEVDLCCLRSSNDWSIFRLSVLGSQCNVQPRGMNPLKPYEID